MAIGVNSILNMGAGALFASQASLQTVSNNVSNVNTPGYSRQAVRLESWPALDYYPGQIGQGVNATEVIRYFDKFVERTFLAKNGEYARWSAMSDNMKSVETIFNESGGYGISSLMSSFFSSWEKVSQFPDDPAGRQTLLSNTETLTSSIQAANSSLQKQIERSDSEISEQVERANQIISSIASLNKEINQHYVAGRNNPNTLLDERDLLTRELSALIDVDVIDHGAGDYIVNTKSGHTLVEGVVGFSLSYDGPKAFQTRTTTTTFNGQIGFDGVDGYEYTVEFTQAGALNSGTAKFKVSLDGGRTWVTDEQGNVMEFAANDVNKPVKVKDLDIYFEAGTNNNFIVGDHFTIVPKNALYHVKPTVGPVLISPQQYADGSYSQYRANGGTISGNLMFIDYQAGQIQDKLDEFSKNFTWEVNRIHSQGSGLTQYSHVMGDYKVRDASYPLNSDYIGMPWANRLQEGSFSLALYDSVTGKPVMIDPGLKSALDINFDPSWSLQDLVNHMQAITVDGTDHNGTVYSGTPITNFLDISIVDNRLSIQGKNGFEFGFGNDTTGVLAALGINTYFKGSSASTISLTDTVAQDINKINAGRINGGAESNNGDNISAREIGELTSKNLVFRDWTGRTTTQSITSYYAALVSGVGSFAATSNFYSKSTQAVALQLEERQSEISGVNLDEEMTSLIKFQSSYKAAAKLITTADEMLQTLLSLKQ